MKRILISILTVGVVGAAAFGASQAFFSDTETSKDNIFTAGAIDLEIDNTSYYNGILNGATSWVLKNLTIEKFFDFLDVKPGDRGEDTISLHVKDNDAWVCADVKLTSNNDNGLTEPENVVDTTDGVGNGELASAINFIWWADDGDNVLETGETVLPGGALGTLGVGNTATVALADSQTNIWQPGASPSPLPKTTTRYIGKAWCFGSIAADPLSQGAYPNGPAGDNNDSGNPGEPKDGGISCDGSLLGNETQTDSLTADVTFRAEQARNNGSFVCRTLPSPTPTPVEPTPTP